MHVFDTHPERCQLFASSFDAVVHPSAVACAKESDVLLLAVKPQNLRRLGKVCRREPCDGSKGQLWSHGSAPYHVCEERQDPTNS